MAASVYSRTLQKAAELLGGHDPLRRYLRVRKETLQKWLDDKAVPPKKTFLKTIEVLLHETPAPENDAGSAAPRDCAGVFAGRFG